LLSTLDDAAVSSIISSVEAEGRNRAELQVEISISRTLDIKLPWEVPGPSNIFALSFLDFNPTQAVHFVPFVPLPSSTSTLPAQTRMAREGSQCFAGVKRRIEKMKWPEVQEGRRMRTLLKWRFIIEENLGSSDVGIKLHKAALDLHDEVYLQQIVMDSFAFKKTSTLDKRGNSLLRYLKWHRREYGYAGTPIDESRVYEFLVKEHSSLSATFPTSLSAALNFAHFVVGLK
jgi:hypothetical protein